MLITLTTDFGAGGRYVPQMKGVLYRGAPGATIVDLSHDVPPQDIAAGTRLLEAVTPFWPQETVHLAVIDPGVGTERPIVAVEARGQRFVGPDNGLFGWLNDDLDRAVAIDLGRFDQASSTFHGRDIMAPVAARLALGASLHEFGERVERLATLPDPEAPELADDRITGRVVEVDHYGNLITNIPAEALDAAPHDERLRVTLGVHETFGLWRAYAEQPPQTLLALVGSEGYVELAITNGSAAEMLAAGVGDAVRMAWGRPS